MKKNTLVLAVSLLTCPLFTQAGDLETGYDSITREVVEAQLEFLSSDWMEGRETGKEGQYMAADFIASLFKLYGLEPAGDIVVTEIPGETMMDPPTYEKNPSYFQDFNLVEYWPGDDQVFVIEGKKKASQNYLYQHSQC